MNKTRNLVLVEPPPGAIRAALAAGCPGLQPVEVPGASLADYLRRRGPFAFAGHPLPDLLFVDLGDPPGPMISVLEGIKADSAFRRIPVIAFVAPGTASDLPGWYGMGLNSVIEKPASAEAFAGFLRAACGYWFEHVELATS
ncbi:MAG TPA: response regulator [Candidatus Eisenbacteria bacterium]|jgi:CheY-like chemotaxis protein|nr:response regulator [Candidatus Eisenbacteria bacterium]